MAGTAIAEKPSEILSKLPRDISNDVTIPLPLKEVRAREELQADKRKRAMDSINRCRKFIVTMRTFAKKGKFMEARGQGVSLQVEAMETRGSKKMPSFPGEFDKRWQNARVLIELINQSLTILTLTEAEYLNAQRKNREISKDTALNALSTNMNQCELELAYMELELHKFDQESEGWIAKLTSFWRKRRARGPRTALKVA